MTLWRWSGAAWTRPGVADALLALQDDHDQCVPLLLWALWRLEETDGVDDASRVAAALCRSMNDSVIAPLRAARIDAPPLDRERLLENELKAEHELIDRLETMSIDQRPVANISARDGLSMISALWGRPLDSARFDDLLAALSMREPPGVR